MFAGVQVRCVWRVVLPLLDVGYQVDVRILNAVHYAVPQLRKVRCKHTPDPPSQATIHLYT